jgi:hypothetical protein
MAPRRERISPSRQTRKEALQALREMVQQPEAKDVTAFEKRDLNFGQLADRYKDTRMIQYDQTRSGLLYGVKPSDPLTLVAVSAVLVVVAFFASYIPARQAAKVDPMVALRHD